MKKVYILPQTEIHEVQTTYLMDTTGPSGTGSGASKEPSTDPHSQSPKRNLFY